MDAARARSLIRTRSTLELAGWSSRRIDAGRASGELIRLDHGLYVDRDAWVEEYSEGQHLLRVVAAQARLRGGDVVASHVSAAVVHGLPLYRHRPSRVHMTGQYVDGRVKKSAPLVAHHRVKIADHDIVVVDGIRCTSLSRTVADTIRVSSRATAVALADAAIRRDAWDSAARAYDSAAADQFRMAVRAHLPRGGRGVRQARWVLEFADGRSESVGESGSRVLLWELGFATPRLQVAIPGPYGEEYRVDFGLDDVNAWGEFDGASKYTDSALRGGLSLEEVVQAEKAREDWIRGTTDRRFLRWGFEHTTDAKALGLRLAQFHVRAP